jgi:hypothetical protein
MVGAHYFQWPEKIKPIFRGNEGENHSPCIERPLRWRVLLNQPMHMEQNRRTFLAVLGSTAVAMAARPRTTPEILAAPVPTPSLYFFTDVQNNPIARPRTSAINYVAVSKHHTMNA